MTVMPDATPPGDGARDAAAYTLIYDTRATRLQRAYHRAERWIAGLSALITILTTAMVVKGPDNFAKAEGTVRGIVLALMVAGTVGIGIGLVCAYTAAFGGLLRPGKIDRLIEKPPTRVEGAAQALESAATSDARTSRRFMRLAVGATVAAMLCLIAAVSVAWFAKPKVPGANTTCLKTNTGVLVLAGDVIVKSGTANFVKCP